MSPESATHDIAEQLGRAMPFCQLATDALVPLAEASSLIDLAPHRDLVSEGAPADAFYVVADGALVVFRDAVGAPEVLYARLHSRDVYGHVALFGTGRHTASVRASEASRVVSVPAAPFCRFLDRHPAIREELEALAVEQHSAYLATALAVERNRQMRVRLHHDVRLELADGTSRGARLHNLSVGGFCLDEAPVDWQPGNLVEFGLGLGEGTLRLGGRVVWRRDGTVGLQFTSMSANHDLVIQLAIRLLLESSEQGGRAALPS